ncbi:hypothetical protein UB43_18870 [Pseudomonas sp. 21]|uniref:DUF7079 family protein n=1 Tax=unclassified Pseudomonas TaxID=196821 RepID=UPI0005EAD514|nr:MULTISPECIES: hypothetical protein [unclassified Pseudomonas]KJJ98722.1 hypothetical protein UB43_18870 [Pseudomonas sp. 21]MBV7584486.1 hypothetical protein [Pseudomonas sp. PDM33]
MNDPARESVWLALSELWLDTEPSDADLNYIARTLAESDYCVEELEAIYRREVVPAVYPNALSVAGEWTGFDADWLFGKCRQNRRQANDLLFRWRCWLLSRTVGRLMNEHWQQVLGRVSEFRELMKDDAR